MGVPLSDDILYRAPPWLTTIVFLAILTLAAEVGYRAGRRARRKAPGDDVNTDFGVIQGAVLGLLGLLLAFTYSFVATRADNVSEDEAIEVSNASPVAATVPLPSGAPAADGF